MGCYSLIISAGRTYIGLCTILPFFIMYTFPSLFMSASCWRNSLCLFCSPGVRSGVINNLRMCSGLPDNLSLSLFLRIKDFSCIELTVIFNRRGLSDFYPRRTALVMDAEVPK